MIEFSVNGNLALIHLNRIESLNALSLDMWQSIEKNLSLWKDNPKVKVIVIDSASPKFFSAGGDVRALYAQRKAPVEELMPFFKKEYQTIYQLHTYPKPIVSLMNGVTMGGGVGLGMHVAFPIAGEDIVFAMPETAIGLFPDVGATNLFNRMPISWQHYLGLFGGRLSLTEVCRLGLVKAFVPTQKWDALKQQLATYRYTDDVFKDIEKILDNYQESTKNITNPCSHMAIFEASSLNDLLDNIGQQSDLFFQELNHKISALSPLSMLITFEQIHLIQGKNLKECLSMDYTLIGHFMRDSDFFEGVRALLIDKDKKPQWKYKTIQDVPYAMVQEFFYHPLNQDLFTTV